MERNILFWAHLPTLTSSATSAHTSTKHIWHELPTPAVEWPTLIALQGHLLLVGGIGYVQKIHHYDLKRLDNGGCVDNCQLECMLHAVLSYHLVN